MFGLRDGMKVLECGCGPGHVIEKLLPDLSRLRGDRRRDRSVPGPRKAGTTVAALGTRRVHIFEQSITALAFPGQQLRLRDLPPGARTPARSAARGQGGPPGAQDRRERPFSSTTTSTCTSAPTPTSRSCASSTRRTAGAGRRKAATPGSDASCPGLLVEAGSRRSTWRS